MNHREYPAHRQLTGEVRGYWSHEETHTPDTAEHVLIPDARVELSFQVGEVFLERGGTLQPMPSVYLTGLRETPWRLVAVGAVRVFGVSFSAWGASRLLGLEAGWSAFRSGVAPELLGLSGRIQPLLERSAYPEIIALIESWLLERARHVSSNGVNRAGDALNRSGGLVRVAELAAMLGLSVRQFQRRFRLEAGVSPKALARLIRFERASQHLMTHPDTNLTELAYTLGYADQAHFSREFRRFAGQSPSLFARAVREGHWFAG